MNRQGAKLSGASYFWTTPGGDPVNFPNAYRRAFGKPVYHGSTYVITVGCEWLAANGLPSPSPSPEMVEVASANH